MEHLIDPASGNSETMAGDILYAASGPQSSLDDYFHFRTPNFYLYPGQESDEEDKNFLSILHSPAQRFLVPSYLPAYSLRSDIRLWQYFLLLSFLLNFKNYRLLIFKIGYSFQSNIELGPQIIQFNWPCQSQLDT